MDGTMKKWTQNLALVAFVTCIFAMALPATAQERGGEDRADRGERGQRDDRRQRWENMSEEEREEMRQRFAERRAEAEKERTERMKEQLGMSDDEFEVISPLIEKVRTAIREREMVSSTRNTRGGQRGGGFDGELSEPAVAATEALAELRQAIEDDNAGDIKDALAKLRKSRAAMDTLVKDAREELRSVCTANWEAQFVLMGLLD